MAGSPPLEDPKLLLTRPKGGAKDARFVMEQACFGGVKGLV